MMTLRTRGQAMPPAPPAEADPLQTLESLATTLHLEPEKTIHEQGDPAEFCYRVVSGCVRVVKLMEDGRRQVSEFLVAGDSFGFESPDVHDFATETVTNVVLRRYPRHGLEALADRNVAFARRLRVLTAGKLQAARRRMVLLGRKTAVERIASFVLEMSERLPARPDGRFKLPMSRTDMADYLGLTIETVCRTLAGLRRLGVIDVKQSMAGILNRTSLQQLASEPRH
jgi:CRP-like cAMP-binding protein